MTKPTQKIIDTCSDVSSGGRAQRYWREKTLKRSTKYEIENSNKSEINQIELIKKYNLRGFEYGNWVNNNDRYDRLFALRDSLADLSKIIGSKNIGLAKKIGIGIGARGKGKALAHFEPDSFMINLTKEKGHSTLAHEYGHALDYFFGMYIDQCKKSAALSGGCSVAKLDNTAHAGKMRKLMNEIINSAATHNGKPTESYTKWKQVVGETSEYWFRRNEIFARIFEQWVCYQMKKKGLKNTFLTKAKYEPTVYLTAKDFSRIRPKVAKLIGLMAKMMNN